MDVPHVLPAVQRRNTIPILSNIRVNVGKDHAVFSATDMDMELSVSVDAIVSVDGSVTVPAAPFARFLSVMPADELLTIAEADDGATVVVSSGEASISLLALPAADFPDMELGAMGAAAVIPAGILAKAMRCTTYAISREETRYYLNGVHVRRKNGVLTLEATDGHRLVQYGVPDVDGVAFAESAIIPRVPVQMLAAAVASAKPEDTVSIRQCARGVAVSMPSGVHMLAKHTRSHQGHGGAIVDFLRAIKSPENGPSLAVGADFL